VTRTNVRFIPVDAVEDWNCALPVHADIYARPGYVRAAAGEGFAFLVEVACGPTRLLVPIVERAVPEWLGQTGVRDAESPYGYPGVYGAGDASRIDDCWRDLSDALRERGVVSLFLRLNPLERSESLAPSTATLDRETRYVPLELGLAEAFAGNSCRTHRSQVRRAALLRITGHVEDRPSLAEFEQFKLLYDATMVRVAAAKEYIFPLEYYARLVNGCARNLGIVSARDATGAIVAQAILMAGPQFAHYHLSARVESAHNVTGHVILQAAAEWAFRRELKALHLGGGRTRSEADPLYQFKARIGRGIAAFRTARIVTDCTRHEELIARAAAATERRSDWFHAYRDVIPNKADA
jgi:hypothetical protein